MTGNIAKNSATVFKQSEINNQQKEQQQQFVSDKNKFTKHRMYRFRYEFNSYSFILFIRAYTKILFRNMVSQMGFLIIILVVIITNYVSVKGDCEMDCTDLQVQQHYRSEASSRVINAGRLS